MSPHLAQLDRALATRGENVVLRRRIGSTTPATYVQVTVRGLVRGYEPHDLVGGIVQGDTKIILSPTGLTAAGSKWPGAAGGSFLPAKNDQTTGQRGAIQTVQAVSPIYVDGVLVRIEMAVRG